MIILVLVVLGLAFGSFINALNWRIYKQSQKGSNKRQEYSIVTGRSMCSVCRHPLATKDLVPLVSWLLLRGKCRYCRKPIADTPLPEILLPILFVLSYIFWPYSWNAEGIVAFVVWLVMLVGLTSLALYDLKWFLLPNRIIFPLAYVVLGYLGIRLIAFDGGWPVLLDALWGFLVGGCIFWALFELSDGKWIGGGDVKLGWLLGIILGGPLMSLLMIFLASMIGTVVSLPMLVSGRLGKSRHVPFGPLLIVAAVIVRLFGASMILWYKRNLGI